MVTLNRDIFIGIRPLIQYGYRYYPSEELTLEMMDAVKEYNYCFLHRVELLSDKYDTIEVDAKVLKNIRPIVNYALMNIHDSELTEEILNDASIFNSHFVTCSELF